ncbi:MAG: hypothetical protein AAF468_13735, partial [Pseudomonadota bacterium]
LVSFRVFIVSLLLLCRVCCLDVWKLLFASDDHNVGEISGKIRNRCYMAFFDGSDLARDWVPRAI